MYHCTTEGSVISTMLRRSLWLPMVQGSILHGGGPLLSAANNVLPRKLDNRIDICRISQLNVAAMAQLARAMASVIVQHRIE